MTRFNSTFRGSTPSTFNACVGNNGSPDYWDYAAGFSQAADVLINQVLMDPVEHSLDQCIYPACFNMRHSVELQLKGAIQQLQKIAEIRGGGFEFDLSGSHDIGLIWHFFRTKSQSVDARYTALNERIETHILDIAEVDPTGQTFRYPIDTQSQKHLTKVSVISFYHLKVQFSILRAEGVTQRLEGSHDGLYGPQTPQMILNFVAV